MRGDEGRGAAAIYHGRSFRSRGEKRTVQQIAEQTENHRSKAPLGGSCRRRRLRGDTFKTLDHSEIPSPSKRFRRAFLPPPPQGEAWTRRLRTAGAKDFCCQCAVEWLANRAVPAGTSSKNATGVVFAWPRRADHAAPGDLLGTFQSFEKYLASGRNTPTKKGRSSLICSVPSLKSNYCPSSPCSTRKSWATWVTGFRSTSTA